MRTHNPVKGSPKTPWIIYVIFSLLAITSAAGLDYINWSKGKKSYVFSILSESRKPKKPKISISQVVLDRLSRQGIPDDSVSKFKDQAGIDHLKIDLSMAEYTNMEIRLRQDLLRAKAKIVKKEQQEDKEKTYFLWDVQRHKAEKLAILFSCKKEPPEIPEELPEVPKEKPKVMEKPPIIEPKYKVALIMDDMGYSLDAIYDILSLQEPITVAIIPFSPVGEQTAQIANQNGLEILLHLPLESINNTEANNNIEGIITTDMSEQEIITLVERNLDQVPYISGVNNHMGSKVTPIESLMYTILQRLKQRNLFFVDSRTTGKSVAYDVALQLEIPTAQRHVFLDSELDEGYIREKLIELFILARKRGEAVGICHPLPETLKVLKESFRLAKEYGVTPVFISELVR
ncbi:MAG: divergent polysaccharide deacetylase family protein [Candidatus Aminicenantaceae bacterium]